MLKGGVRPAGGRLGAADIPAPAGPGGGGPAASAQPPCPRCKQSLTKQQGAHGKVLCRVLTFSQLLPHKESLCCPTNLPQIQTKGGLCLQNKQWICNANRTC